MPGFWQTLGNVKLRSVLPTVIAFILGYLFNLLIQVNITIEELQSVIDAALTYFK